MENTMQLSSSTIQVLKNFASINPNMTFTDGGVLKTRSERNTIFAKSESTVPEDLFEGLPEDGAGIYDLNEFLSMLTLVDNPEIEMQDKFILIKSALQRSRIKYYLSDKELLTDASKSVKMPEAEVSFFLDWDTKTRIEKAANLIYPTDPSSSDDRLVKIKPSNGLLVFTVENPANPTSNSISIDCPGSYPADVDFEFGIKIEFLKKLMADDYEVKISSKKISEFKSTTLDRPIEYYIALDLNSKYGE